MADRRINIFFYGLFMDAELLLKTGAHPENIRPASLPGFALRIGQRATLLPDAARCVCGVVAELTHSEIDALYSDPSVHAYRPEAVVVEFADGSRSPALCFNLVVPPGEQESNAAYAASLRDLAQRLGFPSEYVHSIK